LIAPDSYTAQPRAAGAALPAPSSVSLSKDYAAVLAGLFFGSTLLVVLLASRDPRSALMGVFPAVLLALACSAGCGLYLLSRPRVRPWQLLCMPAIACAAGMLAAVALHAALHAHTFAQLLSWPLVKKALLGAPIMGTMLGASLLLMARVQERERAAWQREAAVRLRSEQLERERVQADLQLLEAQIEPHFLYNTLANLRQLIALDSQRAAVMLESLIRYFKLVLPGFRHDSTSLGDQLALVQAYLELMHERVGMPVRLEVQVPAAWHDVALLPGALICLVENAVKHGRPDDGSVPVLKIQAQRHTPTVLRLTVQDNGPGLGERTAVDSTGIGLSNLRERLRLRYGEHASLCLREHACGGCEAVLNLPWILA
jgi:LytS/YehU family sensor histidine kinase